MQLTSQETKLIRDTLTKSAADKRVSASGRQERTQGRERLIEEADELEALAKKFG